MKAGQIEKGHYILLKNEPYLVSEREFVTPGKGSAFVRCKLKNVRTGQVLRETIKTQENIEIADVVNKNSQYLYDDTQYYHFMETEHYEQFTIDKADFENHKNYLQDGETYQVVFFQDTPLDIILPPKVVLEVVVAHETLKGDTATSVTKIIECSTGAKVKVPGFIKEGDKILVNTETGEYTERINN